MGYCCLHPQLDQSGVKNYTGSDMGSQFGVQHLSPRCGVMYPALYVLIRVICYIINNSSCIDYDAITFCGLFQYCLCAQYCHHHYDAIHHRDASCGKT